MGGKRLVLQVVQPGLAGLMDGSFFTLAPVFAAAFAIHKSWDAFLVGMAASLGARISMGFAEALSDDGVLSGRGLPWARGLVCGLMTTAGGMGHTLPFPIVNFYYAIAVAIGVVAIELAAIAWIRHRDMDTPLLAAPSQAYHLPSVTSRLAPSAPFGPNVNWTPAYACHPLLP